MGKFFNHYCPDRAVGFGHPYSDRRPETWHYTLGYRGYDLDVVRDVSLWQVGIHPRKPNCRSFIAARFEAIIRKRQFSKQSVEWTQF